MRSLPTPAFFPVAVASAAIATVLAAPVCQAQARGAHARADARAHAANAEPVPVYVPKSQFGKIMAVMITTLVEKHHKQAQLQPAGGDGQQAAADDASAQPLALEAGTPGE